MTTFTFACARGRQLGTGLLATLATALLATVAGPVAGARAASVNDATVADFSASVSNNVAGAHPNLTISFQINGSTTAHFSSLADSNIDGPAGLLGDPGATPVQCSQAQLIPGMTQCPVDSQVGVAVLSVGTYPVFNMVPGANEAARLGFWANGDNVPTEISVVPRSDGDFGLHSDGAVSGIVLTSANLTLWGVPADSSHDAQRVPCLENGGSCPADYAAVPFLTNPTECDGPDLVTTGNFDFWGDLGDFQTLTSSTAPPVDCQALPFDPSISLTPTTTQVDEPTGLSVDVHLPQNDDPNSVATSAVKQAVVTLPAGVTLSPSAATRLSGCSDAELGVGSSAAASCPAESQIGTAEIDTPLLPQPLLGTIYLGSPDCAASVCTNTDAEDGQMYRMFVVASGFGMEIKLVGNVSANPATGQLAARFTDPAIGELPQVPFSDFKLFFKGGSTAPLANPLTCQTLTTTSDFTPYALNGDKFPTSSYATSSDGNGGACPATTPFAPQLSAGSSSTQAGANTNFVLDLTRPDGNQYLSGLTVTTPPGLEAKLAGVPMCPTAEAQAGTCPAATMLGSVTTESGTGPSPLSLPGSVYLAEPTVAGDVADLSIVVPAVAGPYNLGTVVVLAHVHVDPEDAHLTVTSDPLPTILDGIPLRIHAIELDIDRPGFMLNPTSCDPMTISATATSTQGATANMSSRFQVGGCSSLAFTPKLKIGLTGKGRTKSGDHPTLTATLNNPAGQANISTAKVTLPLSLALDPNNSNHVCAYATAQAVHGGAVGCPASTVVGEATAVTPLLAQPLTGKVYLVQGIRTGAQGQQIKTLPSLLVPLRGQIALDLRAQSSVNKAGALVTTFSTVPDAPVSTFTLQINGGKKGLLVVTGRGLNICQKKQVGNANFAAQSGDTQAGNMTLSTPCAKAAKLQVLSKKTSGESLTLRVRTSERGTVSVTGKQLAGFSKTLEAGTHQIKVQVEHASTRGSRAKHAVSTNVTVQIAPANARATATTFHVTI